MHPRWSLLTSNSVKLIAFDDENELSYFQIDDALYEVAYRDTGLAPMCEERLKNIAFAGRQTDLLEGRSCRLN